MAQHGQSDAKRRRLSADLETRALREDLALAYRLCEHFKFHEGVCNHLSVELPSRDKFCLIDYGVHWSQATASDILVIDHDGHVVEGTGCPEATGFPSHRAFHRGLGESATATLHAHPPFATALMALKRECGGRILPVHQGYLRYVDNIAYEETWGGFFDNDVSDVTASIAKRWQDEHGGRCPRILLSANHGVFAFGATIAEAWDNLYYLERLAEVQVRALGAVGGDVSKLQLLADDKIVKGAAQEKDLRQRAIDEHWRAMQGMMRNVAPNYKN